MACLVGTDEAGYGPNLGPLVITATAWRVPGATFDTDLYELLGGAVSAEPVADGETRRVRIADSKILFRPGGGLGALERGVLSALRVTGAAPRCWRDVLGTLDPQSGGELDAEPWYADYEAAVPQDVAPEQMEQLAASLRKGLDDAGAALLAVRSIIVFPRRLNDLVDRCGGKGAVLSLLTVSLVRQLVLSAGDDCVLVHCDKHGGRNKYGPVLQEAFPEHWVQVLRESRDMSLYRWGPPARRVQMRFVAQGERYLPSALASMASKYARELAMQAFNDFWRRRIPGLKPTAGYPLDARRFRSEIRFAFAELGVGERTLWRNR
jgi:hypothetical protein